MRDVETLPEQMPVHDYFWTTHSDRMGTITHDAKVTLQYAHGSTFDLCGDALSGTPVLDLRFTSSEKREA